MKTNIFTFLFLLSLSSIFAQQNIDDELIIRLRTDVDATSFQQSLSAQRNISQHILEFKTVGPTWRLHKLIVDEREAAHLIETLAQNPDVEAVGYNFQLEKREVTPNDELYGSQWDMDIINAPEVWEFTTGGVTALGDTIVVANLEDTDVYHEDLIDNIWINHNEIPNNGEDDDGNGYVDDYMGYNIGQDNDNHPGNSSHGTEVSGIMGARGDNGIGITGVNWNVKLMVVSNNLQFDQIISSYQYVLDMRTLYNETDGEKGAFIVATNASFGASGFPDSNPFFMDWCNIYDALGAVGVLSAGATSNANVDIDEVGDMPTSCPSDYLISVTDINQSNQLRGGYSVENIDLGAPGSEVPSTNLGNQYTNIGGTSSATPHIAGGIALLYSIPCESWAQIPRDDPEMAATLMKSFIMEGTAPLEALEGKSVTGGLLDLKGSLDLMQNYCGSFTGPLEILKVKSNLSGQNISVEYQTPENGPYTMRVYDAIGRLLIDQTIEPELFELKAFDIDVSNFAVGVYFLSIENNENIESRPFVVYYE